jgi:hypothetical protein
MGIEEVTSVASHDAEMERQEFQRSQPNSYFHKQWKLNLRKLKLL